MDDSLLKLLIKDSGKLTEGSKKVHMASLKPKPIYIHNIVVGICVERIFLRKYTTSTCRINYIWIPKPLILNLNVLFSDLSSVLFSFRSI